MIGKFHLRLAACAENYVFFDFESGLALDLSHPAGYADRVTPSIRRGLMSGRLDDMNGLATVEVQAFVDGLQAKRDEKRNLVNEAKGLSKQRVAVQATKETPATEENEEVVIMNTGDESVVTPDDQVIDETTEPVIEEITEPVVEEVVEPVEEVITEPVVEEVVVETTEEATEDSAAKSKTATNKRNKTNA